MCLTFLNTLGPPENVLSILSQPFDIALLKPTLAFGTVLYNNH